MNGCGFFAWRGESDAYDMTGAPLTPPTQAARSARRERAAVARPGVCLVGAERVQVPLAGTAGQVLRHVGHHVGGRAFLVLAAFGGHAALTSVRSALRPRLVRVLTVPSGTPMVSAARAAGRSHR